MMQAALRGHFSARDCRRHLVTAVFPCNRICRGNQVTRRQQIERSNAMQERQVDIPTKDGKTTTFIVHPDRGGPFPVILFYMDAPAIREELRDMARRFASSGYYVVLPNMYYRKGVMELGPLPTDPNDPR